MPAIGPGSLVLVTGASGFLAAHCVHQLLERGHSVRGTVRSNEKGEYLKKLFKRHGDKFQYVIAEDLEKPNVFDEAVKGVDGVLHTASPFHMNAEGRALDALVNPAVNGTKSVLASIAKENKVKRVVVTSSFAAIIDSKKVKPPHTFTEADWNESDPIQSEQEGNAQSPAINAYRASKTLAERAAWDFVEANKPSFDLATINPPLVLGPIIHQVNSPDSLNTSAANIWKLMHGGSPTAAVAVDVRDTAKAHVEALLRPDAGGQRFGPSYGPYTYQEVSDIIHATKVPIPDEWKKNTPTDINDSKAPVNLDGSKTERELGVQYHTFKQTIEDTLTSFVDYHNRGWKGVTSEEVLYLP
ncbi:NAD(P)-binding protein [Meira miltonrushii]|uniref:NAD(P)-binding protein n=1 Tax=Meira miltonrushii TaxID=1280837 RepID=A0A316VD48_9BASI|nr:NAD(P)-binding protein [Meira miltonrushii]PWN34163.1 NAD(P)-binding protein [Meira miltonrushii]